MDSVKRRPGGQPKNTNALKHGFYSRNFRELESADLTKLSDGLNDEILLLKVTARRLFELSSAEEQDLETTVKILSALGSAATRIATLARTQKLLDGAAPDISASLNQALNEVLKEMK